jgi:alcohol dehydrogenase class IV
MPSVVTFGYGVRSHLPEIIARYGSKPLFVTGRSSLRATGAKQELLSETRALGLDLELFEGVEAEPLVETVDAVREMLDAEDCDVVVSVGGGSVMDVGKAAAALADSDLSTREHLAGAALPEDAVPNIAVPTTAGTGSEVTPNAVLRDLQGGLKQSIRGNTLLPVAAVVDPQLTMSMPPRVTAHTGMDALTQAIEAFTSIGASAYTDCLAIESVLRLGKWLPLAYRDGSLWPARENVALGSLLAGMALASARSGLVHGLAHPLGLLYDIPHGLVCALLLPDVMVFNAPSCGDRYAMLARALEVGETAEDLAQWTRDLCREVAIGPPLAEFGLREDHFAQIIPPTMTSGSTKHNPREATEENVAELLRGIIAPSGPA